MPMRAEEPLARPKALVEAREILAAKVAAANDDPGRRLHRADDPVQVAEPTDRPTSTDDPHRASKPARAKAAFPANFFPETPPRPRAAPMDGTFNYSAIWDAHGTAAHGTAAHGGGDDDAAAEAEALVAEEAARMETQAAAEAAAAAREARWGQKSADELLRHTEAALNDEPAPPTPVAAASPLALAQFEASVAALAAPAADAAAEPTPMAPVEAKELAELDVTLEATELRIQLLHATLNPPAPTPVVADADDADEADADLNLLASLAPPPRRTVHERPNGRKVAAESTLRDAHATKRAEKGSPEKAAVAEAARAPLAASWADEYVGSQEDDDDDDYDEAWGEEGEMEAVDEEYDDFDEDEEFEASEEEEGEEEAGGEVSVVRVPVEKRSSARQGARQLGAEVFAAVYQYLRSKSADFYAADYDIQMRNDLLRICGEGRLRFWPLVDQLIFCEDVEKDAHRHVDDCW